MLINEAIWFGDKLGGFTKNQLSPALNIGSGTDDFRKKKQYWIDNYIFSKLRNRQVQITHLDVFAGLGIDLVGNLYDDRFWQNFENTRVNAVFLNNVLEHVQDKKMLCERVLKLLNKDGYIFVSVPFKYPYHPNPVDSLFRPTISEVEKLFPKTKLVDGEYVACGTFWEYLIKNKMIALLFFVRLFVPFYKYDHWQSSIKHLPWLSKHFVATCCILKKGQ